ncbi:cytochrome p450 [Rhizoctonia solani]|uniref:Cytochrome p450 n=1 Tax=Rhizoctonia solani TaxID=456999 RepID=A0A8H7IAR7_9AGAM|nr:cytochrome p450 [Rhizoctonia solani]
MFRLVRSGHHSEAVKELHEKYGTFVRLGPNHISIADPDAFESVYGHGNGLLKSEFYDAFQGGPKLTHSTRAIKPSIQRNESDLLQFLATNVLSFEPRVRSHIQKLCAQWDLRCDEAGRGVSGINWVAENGKAVINVCAQFSYLAFDIIGDLSLGSPFGLVQAQKDSSLSVESVDVSGETKQGTLATTLVDARLKRGSGKDMEDGSGKRNIDLIDKLIEIQDENGNPLPKDEMIAEAVLLLVAGSDTVSNNLSSLFYHLAMQPEIQQELQAELDKHIIYDDSHRYEVKEGVAVPGYDVVAWYDDIKGLPFLNACVKETLQIRIAGQTFKPGSVISVPSYTTNRASVWDSNATEFQPKRWLDDKSGSLSKYFVPFSVGPRACIGRNLGYMELMLIAATLVRRYDIEALPITKMVTHEGFTREAVIAK